MTGSSSESDTDVKKDEDVVAKLKIRKELSTLTFEELLKMKEEIGAKAYNEKVFGYKPKAKGTQEFKRANKNRPREMSSKIRPTRIMLNNEVIPKIKNVPRDPRFDSLCGTFDKEVFKSNYKFVNDIRLKEKKQLENELKTNTDPAKKEQIKLLLQRLENQIREEKKNEKEKEKERAEKRDIREKLKKGEKPVYKKKSVKKLEGLIEKYEDLKKNNKLSKHIEKRSKKLSTKERKKIKEL